MVILIKTCQGLKCVLIFAQIIYPTYFDSSMKHLQLYHKMNIPRVVWNHFYVSSMESY
jgi:hypothetical protein